MKLRLREGSTRSEMTMVVACRHLSVAGGWRITWTALAELPNSIGTIAKNLLRPQVIFELRSINGNEIDCAI